MTRLSYSSISTYQNCPLKYYYQYVEARPSLPSPALSFGSSVHEALRWLYESPTGEPPGRDELLAYLEECWDKEGYRDADERFRYFLQAKSTLELFYRNNVEADPESFRLPVALEHKFVLDLGFCDLSGQIDRLDKDPAGLFEIIDYKTNRRLPPARRLREDLQLPIYQLAAERIWEIEVDRVTFYYLVLDHRYTQRIDRARIDHALEQIERVAREVTSERFDPCRNNLCPWCDYLEECPGWEGEQRPARRVGGNVPRLYIGQVVDELIATDRQIARKQAGVEALRQSVLTYLEQQNADKVGGSLGYCYLDEDGLVAWREGEPPADSP